MLERDCSRPPVRWSHRKVQKAAFLAPNRACVKESPATLDYRENLPSNIDPREPPLTYILLAVRQGFEPWIPSRVYSLSKRARSATPAPHLKFLKCYLFSMLHRFSTDSEVPPTVVIGIDPPSDGVVLLYPILGLERRLFLTDSKA